MPDQFLISTDRSLLDVDTIYAFLSACYWSPGIARSRVERAIENSMCFAIYDTAKQSGPRQIAFARVITDKATYGYIADVFVLPEYRGRGLSKRLMAAIVEHPDLMGLRRLCLMTRDAQGLYAQFGFAATPDPTRYMEVVDRESYKRD
ncbi:MAG: GNAT family N-acetyltransferase [Phycisphaerae bacterium]|nr:GNAT family N-acetyltransferase [Phycisphaerae bacterium]